MIFTPKEVIILKNMLDDDATVNLDTLRLAISRQKFFLN